MQHASRGHRSHNMQQMQQTQNMNSNLQQTQQALIGSMQYTPLSTSQLVRDQQNRLSSRSGPLSSHSNNTQQVQQQQRSNNKQPSMHQTVKQQQQQQTLQILSNQQNLSRNRFSKSQQQQIKEKQQQQLKNLAQPQIIQQTTHQQSIEIQQNNIITQSINQNFPSSSSSTQSTQSCPTYPKAILQNTSRHNKTSTAPVVNNETNIISSKTATNIVSLNQPNVPEFILLNSRTKVSGSITAERLSTITEVPQENCKILNDRSNSHSPNQTDSNNKTSNGTDTDQQTENSSSAATTSLKECQVSSSKEKTPMCLVNELARYNKILHQYRLTAEKGPAHSKRFVVTLKLGDEEYSAEGNKIKKAQHLAAAEAIEKTKYKHPLPKAVRRLDDGTSRATITPTVELNALAMKLGQQTYYLYDTRSQSTSPSAENLQYQQNPYIRHQIIDPQGNNPYMRRNNNGFYTRDQRFLYRGYQQKLNSLAHSQMIQQPTTHLHQPLTNLTPSNMIMPVQPNFCRITLIVGKQKFIGTGRTLQAAKHDAASRALQMLKAQAASKLNEILNPCNEENDGKSPISQVHEIALKRNFTVAFKVVREEGPAHMRNFVTECIVGSITTQGEGNGKKISKKRAAEKMLEELKNLPPISPSKSPVRKLKIKLKNKSQTGEGSTDEVKSDRKKRSNNSSIKERSTTDDTDSVNPVSKLIEITQSHKEKDPVYELVCKVSEFKRREFVIEVSAHGLKATGTGVNKKIAKRNAARNLLNVLENNSTGMNDANQENNSQLSNQKSSSNETVIDKETNGSSNDDCKAKEKENTNKKNSGTANSSSVRTSTGQIPGILILGQSKRINASTIKSQSNQDETDKIINKISENSNLHDINNESEDKTSKSVGAVSSQATNQSSSSNQSVVRPVHQLLYLSQILGFTVDFSDFPKGNHTEFLTIVTLSSSPPQICHGIGITREASQDDAARAALNLLSELGLDNSNSKKEVEEEESK